MVDPPQAAPNVVLHPRQAGAPKPAPNPNECAHCHAVTVLCRRCDERYPITDRVRHVTHVGICPEHGVIDSSCPANTHYTRRRTDPAPDPRRRARFDLQRVAAIGLLVGMIIGFAIGLLAAIAIAAQGAL